MFFFRTQREGESRLPVRKRRRKNCRFYNAAVKTLKNGEKIQKSTDILIKFLRRGGVQVLGKNLVYYASFLILCLAGINQTNQTVQNIAEISISPSFTDE